MKFGKRGNVVVTRGICNNMADDIIFSKEVTNSLKRHFCCDWGDLTESDKQLNNDAIKYNNNRIFSAYNTSKGRIYVITEYDRSCTTVLFSREY